MILVTLGTQKEQFTRLLDYIENSNIEDEIIVQAGHTKFESKKMKVFDFIPYEEMNKYIEKADLIITHAGTGSILMPLKKGKKVIACARLSKHNEHIDDHQLQIVEVFKEEGYILELNESNNIDDLINEIDKFKPKKYKSNSEKFINSLKVEIDNDKKNNLFKNHILLNTIIIFFTFLLISYFIPLTGDDWTNANFNTNNIFEIIRIAYSKYFVHEGRFMSRIFVIFFTNTKWLWNIMNAIMVSSVYYISIKLIKPKKILFTSLVFAFSMFFIENTMFTQSYLWVTGNVTYFLPMFLYLLYIFTIRKVFYNKFKFNKATFVFTILLNLLIPTMVEHISVALVCSNILLLIYTYIKTKKINKLFLINSIISIVGFLVIYLSPGAALRAKEFEFSNYTLFNKIFTNIPNFTSFTYVSNTVFLCLLVLLLLLFFNKYINGIKKVIMMIIFLPIPLLNILANIFYLISSYNSSFDAILKYISFSKNINNVLIVIFWILISILMLIVNIIHTKKTNNYKAIFFFIVGFLTNLAMLLSPIWGGRTALFTLIMFTINVLIIINEYNFKVSKIINLLLYFIFVVYIVILLILYSSVYRQQKNREQSIKKQLKNNLEVIEIERFPENILWNSNAWNQFHEESFKKYYKINLNTTINRKKINYKYQIFY